MDNLMPDIDRGSILPEGEIDDVDGAIDPCAKTPWIGEINFHGNPCVLQPYVSV
jgi:hypothetical protein